MPDSFFVMPDSCLCHGALVENDESAKRINEPSRRRHESTIKINESVGKNVGKRRNCVADSFLTLEDSFRVMADSAKIHEYAKTVNE